MSIVESGPENLAPHPPRRDVERWLAREVSSEERQRIETHLSSCRACQEFAESCRREQAALEERLPPQAFAARVLARAATGPAPWRRWPLVLATSATSALLLMALLLWRPAADAERWRGGAAVVRVYLDREGQRSLLLDHIPRPGDRLRYEITLPPGQRAYAALVALEDGRALPVLPPSSAAPPFEVAGTSLLPGAAALESGAPARLLLVLRPVPFAIGSLLAEVELSARQGRHPDGVAHELGFAPEAP